MKKLCFLAIGLFIFYFSHATPLITATTTGQWNSNASWDLGRLPQNNDTVLIPIGKTITITNNVNLGNSTLHIMVFGHLVLSGGKLSLNGNSEIKLYTGGSISGMGNASETIKIGGILMFSGTNSNLAGPLLANGSTAGFVPFPELPLSVKFIGFNLTRDNNNVLVQWITAEETNNSYFEIQRSNDGISWQTIATQTANPQYSAINNYSYTDINNTADRSFYRIKQTDLDGRFTMTGIRMIRNTEQTSGITISPAGSGMIQLHFPIRLHSDITISLISAMGQIISKHNYSNPIGSILMPVPSSIKGICVVAITDRSALIFSRKVAI